MNKAPTLCPFQEYVCKRQKPDLLALMSDRLIQSDLFTFHVGKDENRKTFVVHCKAVAATSGYFRALVNNGMAESHTGTVEYPDMEPEDFARFVEYAYRNDYTPPPWIRDETCVGEDKSYQSEPTMQPVIERPPTPPRAAAKEETMEARLSKWGRDLKYGRMHFLSVRFDERNYLGSSHPKEAMLAAMEPQHDNVPDLDFTPVLLAHARLYTFSCMRLVDSLRKLTLHKLHQTLLGFSLYERRVSDVVELARYAYSRDYEATDELRQLVIEYIALNVSAFSNHPSFILMLGEGGDFVIDFWAQVYKVYLMP